MEFKTAFFRLFNYVQSHICKKTYGFTFISYIHFDWCYTNLPCYDPLLSSGQIEPTFRCSWPNILVLYNQRSAVRRNTPFCCRLIIVGNKRNILRLLFDARNTYAARRGHHINKLKYKINNYQQQ